MGQVQLPGHWIMPPSCVHASCPPQTARVGVVVGGKGRRSSWREDMGFGFGVANINEEAGPGCEAGRIGGVGARAEEAGAPVSIVIIINQY